MRLRGAAAKEDSAVAVDFAVVLREADRDGFARVCGTVIVIRSSSSLSLSGMVAGGAVFVDLAARVVFLGASDVAVFFVTRDLASLAFAALVVGMAALVAGFRLGGSSVVLEPLLSAARARVTRRGFVGLATFLGAMVARIRERW